MTYLGDSKVPWSTRPIQVHVEGRIGKDDLNDQDRTVETVTHEKVRYGDVPFIAITWTYGTSAEIRRGDGSGGAGIDSAVLFGMEDPDERKRAQRILELADRWHLNTMKAGCAHQTVVWENSEYGRRPSLELTKPCPETGYRYGSAWLVEVPPAEVIEELRALVTQ